MTQILENPKKEPTTFEESLERLTGRSMQYLRDVPLDQQMADMRERTGEPMEVVSYFPVIGRGNVMRDRTIPHEEVERLLTAALQK